MDAETGNVELTCQQSLRRRKKVRRLGEKPGILEKDGNIHLRDVGVILLLAIIAVFGIACVFLWNHQKVGGFANQFLTMYKKHYNQILHNNEDYCDQNINTDMIMKRLNKSHILHQERALLELSSALRNESQLNIIALVGSSGVGKSLVASALIDHWPWHHNTHYYSWHQIGLELQKFHPHNIYRNGLTNCGCDLIVLDNVPPRDVERVKVINDELIEQQQHRVQYMDDIKVFVIYIFQLNRMEDADTYARHYHLLQQLPHTRVINFASIDENQLKDCIEREAALENVVINQKHIDDIVNTIDPKISGCKNVRAKVLVYGKHVKSD